ncbi:ABC transporter ATP-binding protein [Kibdelosporangium aridum]|uniref:Putative ABC transport system ATP-binding protein n=1 Tax=Kibdelosporangium aridum TaxID=2030 RepID=A0A1W2D2V7_KIBAR|nr:ABC transporter ATP-binding protein [Kibdelosporangium aridum]SMC91368.1 putative ABC transport system ATP-binding protein [Kibdelosporangium aridum]
MKPVIEVSALHKTYGSGETEVHALRGVDLAVWPGEYLAIMGASGSGKSTLLNVLGCLDVPTRGTYKLDGIDVGDLNERQLSLVRNRKIGFVFQSYNLVPRTSAMSNVELPLVYAGVGRKERRERAMAALEMVGLVDRAGHKPNQLSGGQQQRVALARALVTGPAMVLADEPTGNLDSESTDEVLAVFDRLNRIGRTIVMITHEDHVAGRAARMVRVSDGQIVEDTSQWRRTGALT